MTEWLDYLHGGDWSNAPSPGPKFFFLQSENDQRFVGTIV